MKITTLQSYLDGMIDIQTRMHDDHNRGWKHVCLEDFVNAEGFRFTPPSSSDLPDGVERGELKECFSNCWNHMATHHPCGLVYCEGFALNTIPTMHAWLATPDGTVVDPTWEEPGAAYVGVPFQWNYALKRVIEKGYFGVLDDWGEGWPLLVGLDPIEWKWEAMFDVCKID